MTLSVAIAGATGYAGGEILRLLLNHPAYLAQELKIGALTGHSNAGQRLGELMPSIPQLADRIIAETTVAELKGHDVVFLALPHGHSASLGEALGAGVLVIDCAADFRLRNSKDWQDFYGGAHAGSWPYGIPEIPGNRKKIANSNRVAVAGCFPTAITLGALPAVAEGVVEPDLCAVAVTGVSGAGKKAAVGLLGSETMGNLRAYNPGGKHRHTPEIIQNLQPFCSQKVKVSFTPVLAPLPRGILATITAPLRSHSRERDVHELFTEYYAQEKFCLVLPPGQQPETQNVAGTNMVHIQAHVDERAEKLVITSAIDNLCKGTAGGAVQCMNIALGFPEAAGLPLVGVTP